MTTEFLNLMSLLMEVNFSSAFIEKVRIDASPAGISFMRTIAMNSVNKVRKVMAGFTSMQCELSASVIEWCNVALVYFEMMAYYGIFKTNQFMMDKVVEKTKDIETIYFQNHLLANKIIELKHTIQKNVGEMNS